MTTKITIDLNVRVRGNQTYAGFEDADPYVPEPGEAVVVLEPESRLRGHATVTEVDTETRLIYLDVEWSSIRREKPSVPPGRGDFVAEARIDWPGDIPGKDIFPPAGVTLGDENADRDTDDLALA